MQSLLLKEMLFLSGKKIRSAVRAIAVFIALEAARRKGTVGYKSGFYYRCRSMVSPKAMHSEQHDGIR
jgi:hypothetical protein